MRRIGRWTLNTLTALSLLLCVGTCVLWVRSNWVADLYYHDSGYWKKNAVSTRGSLSFSATHTPSVAGWPEPPKVKAPAAFRTRKPWEDTSWTMVDDLRMDGDPGVRSARALKVIAWVISDGGVTATAMLQPGIGPSPGRFPARRTFFARDWFLAAVFAVAPACWLVGFVRRRKFSAEQCECGYNLTGNVSGVCPECGKAVPSR